MRNNLTIDDIENIIHELAKDKKALKPEVEKYLLAFRKQVVQK